MDLRFVAPDLRRLDDLKSEALASAFFVDERPLQGALGLVDWRLCGRLSGLLRQGRVHGGAGEQVLVPTRPRLSFEKLFLFGLGSREAFDEAVFDAAVGRMLDTLTRARVRASTLVLPGRALRLIEAATAVERFLDVAVAHPDHDEVVLVEDPEAQKDMGPIVQRARRRARAMGE